VPHLQPPPGVPILKGNFKEITNMLYTLNPFLKSTKESPEVCNLKRAKARCGRHNTKRVILRGMDRRNICREAPRKVGDVPKRKHEQIPPLKSPLQIDLWWG